MILANITTDTTLDWKASEEPICYPWTATQILTLGMDLFTHKTEKIKRYELLRSYINTLTTVDGINQVNWDTEIPTEANTQTSSQEVLQMLNKLYIKITILIFSIEILYIWF